MGPGAMPELLVTAEPGVTSIIPATIAFTSGGLYQLWLVAINGKGRSMPGPVQTWTAVRAQAAPWSLPQARRSFPLGVRGRESTKVTRRGIL